MTTATTPITSVTQLSDDQLKAFKSTLENYISRGYDAVQDGIWEACGDYIKSLGIDDEHCALQDDLSNMVTVSNPQIERIDY